MSCNYFPNTPREASSIKNPAIQLFGNRLFSDQTVSELLAEFLLVIFSPKRIGMNTEFISALPIKTILMNWSTERLEYAPKTRLNLKLFSFLGASRLDSRHYTHRFHYQTLVQEFKGRINIGSGETEDVIRTIENLFLGFQGAGSGRTWCAQSFLPVSPSLLAGESIWKETKARKSNNEDWFQFIDTQSSFFDMNQHLFFARGGELLYLQVCNALRQPKDKIVTWCREKNLGFNRNEQDPDWLHAELDKALENFKSNCPNVLAELAEFIDNQLDSETPDRTDWVGENRRFVAVGWCNEESWREGYLFTVDLLRLLQTSIDTVERIYLLETACAMQALRTLAMQSSRTIEDVKTMSWPGYRFVISSPEDRRPAVKRLSQNSVKAIEKQIYKAIRCEQVNLPEDEVERLKILKQADKSYGHKLFLGLSKRIGFIVPKRGTGARFILNEQLLRFLVITTVPLEGRLTFDTFKSLLEHRYGLVFDSNGLDRASQWLNGKGIYLPVDTDAWLQRMLEAAGFLIHLSDSCALVNNPADKIEEAK